MVRFFASILVLIILHLAAAEATAAPVSGYRSVLLGDNSVDLIERGASIGDADVVLAKGKPRAKPAFRKAAKPAPKAAKPVATLRKPIGVSGAARAKSLARRVEALRFPTQKVSVSAATMRSLDTAIKPTTRSLAKQKLNSEKAKIQMRATLRADAHIGLKRSETVNDNRGRPPNFGFNGKASPMRLAMGTLIDRYGSEGGRYFSPKGTAFEKRSLPKALASKELKIYRVIKPFNVMSGEIAPWYGQKGGGIQYMSTMTVEKLLAKKYIAEVK